MARCCCFGDSAGAAQTPPCLTSQRHIGCPGVEFEFTAWYRSGGSVTNAETRAKTLVSFGSSGAVFWHQDAVLRQIIARYLMSALMTATLLWGGCLSCPVFFGPGVTAVKNCCHPHGGCKEKPGETKKASACSMQSAVLSANKAADAVTPVLSVSLLLPVFQPVTTRSAGFLVPLLDRGSPPDLNLLHSVLRI